MNEKVVSERCIGYQNGRNGLESVFETILDNGVKRWVISTTAHNSDGYMHVRPSLPLTVKPIIDVTVEEFEERLRQARKAGETK